jgi:hypothetical protein
VAFVVEKLVPKIPVVDDVVSVEIALGRAITC